MGEFDLEVSERIAERTRDPILRAANAHIRDLEADRDSWRDQASERLKDWVDMRVRAETAEQRIRELEQALQGCVDAMLHNGVPVDPGHPARVALTAAQAATAASGKGGRHG